MAKKTTGANAYSGKGTAQLPKGKEVEKQPVFYNGSTMPSSSKSTKVAKKAKTKTVKRKPFFSKLLGALLRLSLLYFVLGLFLCPTTTTKISASSSTKSICKPIHLYRLNLQPHITPHIQYLSKKLEPVIEPYYAPIRPHVQQGTQVVQTGIKKIVKVSKPVINKGYTKGSALYKRHISPKVHYGKIRFLAWAQPYTEVVSQKYQKDIQPVINRITYEVDTFTNKVVMSPQLKLAIKATQSAFKIADVHGRVAYQNSYAFIKPKAIAAINFLNHHYHHTVVHHYHKTVVPGAVKAGELAKKHGYEGGAFASALVSQIGSDHVLPHFRTAYYQYLNMVYEPYMSKYLDPVFNKANPVVSVAASRIYWLFEKIIHHIDIISKKYILPSPPPPTTWEYVASKVEDTLNSATGAIVDTFTSSYSASDEIVDEEAEFLAELEAATNPATVKVPAPSDSAIPEETPTVSETPEEEYKRKLELKKKVAEMREEIEIQHSEWESKIEKVGEHEEVKLLNKLAEIRGEALKALEPKFEKWTKSIEKTSSLTSSGLEKYYAKSGLTIDDIESAQAKSEDKMNETFQYVAIQLDDFLNSVEKKEIAALQQANNVMDSVVGQAQGELGFSYAYLRDVTHQDWKRYHLLADALTNWKQSFASYPLNATSTDPLLLSEDVNLFKAVVMFQENTLDLMEEGWSARMGVLKSLAMKKLDGEIRAAKIAAGEDVDEPTFSILPILTGGAVEAVVAAQGLIGKGQEQVIEALSAASEAVASVVTIPSIDVPAAPTSIVASASSIAESAYGEMTSSVFSVISLVSSSVPSIISSAPSIAESVYSEASSSIFSAASAVSSSAPSLASVATDSIISFATEAASHISYSVEGATSNFQEKAAEATEAVKSVIGRVEL